MLRIMSVRTFYLVVIEIICIYKAQQFDHFCILKGLRSGCLDSANQTFRAEALLAIDENISIIILV